MQALIRPRVSTLRLVVVDADSSPDAMRWFCV